MFDLFGEINNKRRILSNIFKLEASFIYMFDFS